MLAAHSVSEEEALATRFDIDPHEFGQYFEEIRRRLGEMRSR